MRRLLARRPSPAMVVAMIALFASLGGVSYGVATNSIDSREIKNNSVRSKDLRNNDVRTGDLRNNDVRSRDIRNRTITGGDVANDTLSGVNVLESSLAQVPSAARADNAANVDKLKTVDSFKRVTSSASNGNIKTARAAAAEVALFSFGPFDVYGKCFTDTDGTLDDEPVNTVADDNDGVYAEAYIRTRESNSLYDSDNGTLSGNPAFLNTNSPEVDDANNADTQVNVVTTAFNAPPANSAQIDADDDGVFAAAAPSGTSVVGQVSLSVKQGTLAGGDGFYGAGNVCVFWGNVVG